MDDGNTLSTTALILTTALSGLGGALIGVLGGWFIQNRVHDRTTRAALDAVLVEMILNSTCLEMAVSNEQMTQDSAKTLMWNRYGPELVHVLRPEHLRVLQIQQSEIDQVNQAYSAIGKGFTASKEIVDAVKVTLLSWAFRADFLTKRISSDRRLRPWKSAWWRRFLDRREVALRIDSLLKEVDRHVATKLTQLGYEVDDEAQLKSGGVRADLSEYIDKKDN
jgi:hypothetical protein